MGGVAIEARQVSKDYGSGNTWVAAVRNVSLTINKGEVVLILGPSGSGKTTLLSMLGCILTPTEGEILIDGQDVTQLPDGALSAVRKRRIGFVFQAFNLLKSLTVRENVEVALNLAGVRGQAAREAAAGILKEVGLQDRLDFYPADLSGGEKQRVSIARALVNDPEIVLADEPTGNLDSKTGHKIGHILKELATKRGAAVVIVTHDNRIEDIADRTFHIEDGRLR